MSMRSHQQGSACRVRKQRELEELSQRMCALQDDNTSLRGHVETRNTEILRLRGIIQDMHDAEESPQGLHMANHRRSSEAGGSLEAGAAAMPVLWGHVLCDWSAPAPPSNTPAPKQRLSSAHSAKPATFSGISATLGTDNAPFWTAASCLSPGELIMCVPPG